MSKYPPCIYRNASVKAREATPDLGPLVDRDENAWLLNFKCSCPPIVAAAIESGREKNQNAKETFIRKQRCSGCNDAQSDGEPAQFVALAPLPVCVHLGEQVESAPCSGCGGAKTVPVRACAVHGECIEVMRDKQRLVRPNEVAAESRERQQKLLDQKTCDKCPDRKPITPAESAPTTSATP